VGKTYLAEHFARGKRTAYFRCRLVSTSEQLPALGATLAGVTEDPVLHAEPPSMGMPFEQMCRDWVRLALAAGALSATVARVGSWWTANHQIDVVGLDAQGRVALAGEAKWRNTRFGWENLETYLGHLRAMGDLVRPDVQHVLFSKTGFHPRVAEWGIANRTRMLTPADMLAPF
jgi:hypothetical protein